MASTIANVKEQAGGYAVQAGGYAAQLVERAREPRTGGVSRSPAKNEGVTDRAAGNISEGAAATLSASATLGGAALAAPAIAGFTVEGVAAGSMAAAWQSSIGNVAAGSTVAQLQSFGAIYTAAPVLGTALVVVGVGGVVYIGWRRYKSWNAPHPPPGTQDPELLSDTELCQAIEGLGGRVQGCADRDALVARYLLLVEALVALYWRGVAPRRSCL